MVTRTVVFIDYLNVCRTARDTFNDEISGSWPAQIHPLLFGQALVGRGHPGSELTEVRVYRGVPDGRRDSEGFSAALRQMTRWAEMGCVVVQRPLRHPDATSTTANNGQSEQKGLAVALAVDLALLAWRDQYDIAIVCSRDIDLVPGLKAVLDQTWKTIEVASWRSPRRPSERLAVPREKVPCHWLDISTFQAVVDRTDYAKLGSPRSGPKKPSEFASAQLQPQVHA
jgi:uncharacterized LabA/DUF88 family protein